MKMTVRTEVQAHSLAYMFSVGQCVLTRAFLHYLLYDGCVSIYAVSTGSCAMAAAAMWQEFVVVVIVDLFVDPFCLSLLAPHSALATTAALGWWRWNCLITFL